MKMKAPEQQAILKQGPHSEESPDLLTTVAAELAAKELELQALSDSLAATEQTLLRQGSWAAGRPTDHFEATAGLVAVALGSSGGEEGGDALLAARWRCLAAQRAELVVRWQCLLEEKRQLGIALQQGKRGGGSSSGGDFEPGQTPMRDVTCAVVTHQMDVPCLSCCFQR